MTLTPVLLSGDGDPAVETTLQSTDSFSLTGLLRGAHARLGDVATVSALYNIIDENPLLFGDFKGSREELIRILAQYNHAGSSIDAIPGMIDFQSDALAVSLMDDKRRAVFARELLARFLPSQTFVEGQDIEVLLEAHRLHGDKSFWELSAADKLDIRRVLSSRPLFQDKNIQDLLMYHVVCGAGKGFLIGVFLMALLAVGLYLGGAFEPDPAPTTPIPEAPVPKTQEEAKAIVLDPAAIAASFLAQSPDYAYDLDTTRSLLVWRAIIDPEKGLTGGALYRLKRSIELATGMGTAEFTLTSQFFSALGYRASDIASTRKITGTINTANPESTISITGINGVNLTYSHFQAGEDVTETDWADWENNADVRKYLNVARDSMAAMMRDYALPASAFDSRAAQAIARMSGEKAVNAMFGMMGTLIPEIRDHTITVTMEFNFYFPDVRPGFTSGPGFTSAYNGTKFAALGSPGAHRVVVVAVTKRAGEVIYKGNVVSDTIVDDGLLKN